MVWLEKDHKKPDPSQSVGCWPHHSQKDIPNSQGFEKNLGRIRIPQLLLLGVLAASGNLGVDSDELRDLMSRPGCIFLFVLLCICYSDYSL